MKSKKSYLLKLKPDQEPKLTVDRRTKQTMLIPTPMMLAAEVRKIPKGKVRKVGRLRDKMAQDHGVEKSCPLVTGIFLSILAGAAEEQRAAGKKRLIAPYWRVLLDDGSVRSKEPPGIKRQLELLREEGHRPVPRGKKWFLE